MAFFNEHVQDALRHFLAEFVLRYRTHNGREYMPITMNTYLRGIRRKLLATRLPVDYSDEILLNRGHKGLKNVLNYRFARQKAFAMVIKPHTTIPADYLRAIFAFGSCDPNTRTGYRNKLIFSLGLALGERTTALW